jgi:hypothetical protein
MFMPGGWEGKVGRVSMIIQLMKSNSFANTDI